MEHTRAARRRTEAEEGKRRCNLALAVLGIAADATLVEIKRAYRKKALETHPDRGGDPEAFRAVQRAYEKAVKRRQKRK